MDMIRIRIEEAEMDLDRVDESWINQQINRRLADGLTVCVRVTIKEGDLDMVLSTPTCGASGGGGRPPRPREKKVFDLWNQRGIDDAKFTGGNLVAFLKELKRIL
jgi:hypothetical protein